MMTIRELCEKHTSLTSADIEKIENTLCGEETCIKNDFIVKTRNLIHDIFINELNKSVV